MSGLELAWNFTKIGKDQSLFPQATIDAVRIADPADVCRAARALNDLSLAHGFRAAPAHDIAGKRTPVDADGQPLAKIGRAHV